MTAKKIERSTNGIRTALFEEWDALRAGKTTPQKASAVARLASGIISSAKLDVEYQRFVKGGAALASDASNPCVPSLRLVDKAAA